jgi:transposase
MPHARGKAPIEQDQPATRQFGVTIDEGGRVPRVAAVLPAAIPMRLASHMRTSQRRGHVTVNEHMPKAHQRYANMSPASLVERASKIGPNTATFVERLMRDKPHPEQGYRSAMGILSLARRYEIGRLEAACDRALTIGAASYSSVNAILKAGLDKVRPTTGPDEPTPVHGNIRGGSYYQ